MNKTDTAIPVYTYEIINTYNHDPNAFTQGLKYNKGFLYESTGQYGASTLRKVVLTTGKVLKKHELAEDYFGEGITILNNKIYQVTWQEQTGFIYNLENFKLIEEFRYPGEAWGLTNDNSHLIMSNGTHVIRFLNPDNFQTVGTIFVKGEDGKPLRDINDLEYINGEIWANIWRAYDPRILGKPNYIARIDPKTGKIVGWIDLNGILSEDVNSDPLENVLNGIAYDEANDRIFVTGKNWQNLFEIKVKPKA